MNRRMTGVIFVCIAAFLYAVRYLCAAIYGSGSMAPFKSLLNEVGPELRVLGIIALIVGAIYLIVAESHTTLKNAIRDIKSNWREFDPDPKLERLEEKPRNTP